MPIKATTTTKRGKRKKKKNPKESTEQVDSEMLAGPMVQGNEMTIKVWLHNDLKVPGDEGREERRGLVKVAERP